MSWQRWHIEGLEKQLSSEEALLLSKGTWVSFPACEQWLTAFSNYRVRGSDALLWPPEEPGTHAVHIHAWRQNTHMHETKINRPLKLKSDDILKIRPKRPIIIYLLCPPFLWTSNSHWLWDLCNNLFSFIEVPRAVRKTQRESILQTCRLLFFSLSVLNSRGEQACKRVVPPDQDTADGASNTPMAMNGWMCEWLNEHCHEACFPLGILLHLVKSLRNSTQR